MLKCRCHLALLFSLLVFLIPGLVIGKPNQQSAKAKPVKWNGNFADGWKQFEELTNKRNLNDALSLTEMMLAAAQASKNNDEWTRCLIRHAQNQASQKEFDSAVHFLKEQPWPEDLAGSSILRMYYAKALITYAHHYSLDISERERTVSKSAIALKDWTNDQIFEEAQKAFEKVWQTRSQLGGLSNAEWKEFIHPNNYPPGILPTLRDTVSYLYAGMLADTNGWQPSQFDEIHRLNLKNLINGRIDEFSLADRLRHPLEKISLILTDLENWHAQRGEREAALEARLERSRHLHDHFSEVEDNRLIQSDLENHLQLLTDVPWWAEGLAQLASWILSEDEADSYIRARQIASRGNSTYPETIGGKHCLAIIKSIEASEFSISGMHNDNPLKKSLLVMHRNLEKIFFRAYPIDIQHELETTKTIYFYPSDKKTETMLSKGRQFQQWEAALPFTPDYRTHRTFIVPPMTKPGSYLIIASNNPEFSKSKSQLQTMMITISDLVLIARQENSDEEVKIVSASTGEPIAGVDVALYRWDWNKQQYSKETKLTDAWGIALFHTENTHFPCLHFARLRDQIAYDPEWVDFLPDDQSSNYSSLLFTDRSIYRPHQKLLWKIVALKNNPDRTQFETMSAETITVTLKDTNHDEVASKIVTTNKFGTASGEFVIPAGFALGKWHLESSRGGLSLFQQVPIQVEEYKKPTFEVTMKDPEEPLRLNHPAHLTGEAKYLFGLPITTGHVKWHVTREIIFPWWWDHGWWAGKDFRSYDEQIVASGTVSLDINGYFDFTFTPEIAERLSRSKDVSYRYVVSAEVTDEGGETHSVRHSYRVGFVSVEATIDLEKGFFLTTDPVKMRIKRTTLDGLPKAGKGTWRIASLKGPAEALLPAEQPLFIAKEYRNDGEYRTPGDLERERWDHSYNPDAVLLLWEEDSTLASGTISHDSLGNGNVLIPNLAPGAYRLFYETIDDFGTKCELQKNFMVADSSLQMPLPALLIPESKSVSVGDKARLLVHSGIKNQPIIFEIYRKGKCIRREKMLSGTDPSLVEIPITEEDRGGFVVAMTVVRDSQFIMLQSSLEVPWDNKKLRVEFSTYRDRLGPGQQETWSVKITGTEGKDIAVPAAELLAYMYDRSLDAFVEHSPYDPTNLYSYGAHQILASTNLMEARSTWLIQKIAGVLKMPALIKDRLLYALDDTEEELRRISDLDAMAGIAAMSGGAGVAEITPGLVLPPASPPPPDYSPRAIVNPAAIAPSRIQQPIELRSDFSETAFWQPHLLTGADGSVTFEFKVPDSVTSWNVWVHAITRDLKSGSVNREAKTVKELMVRPYLPRFLREGDQAEIKVVVNNASDKELKGSLNFDIIDTATDQSILSQFGLAKSETDGKPFTVPASGGTNLTFPIKTPSKVGQIAFKVTATSGDFTDGELRPIPILPGRMHLMQSRFITMSDPGQRVMRFDDLARNNDPTRINEQMVVTLDAQLFYSVLSALPYLVNYPYECTEQTLNRFVSTGILSSLYQQYPAIDRMAKEFSSRQTQFEQWDTPDPNRKMSLEETPWLEMAKGGKTDASHLINVLDSRIAKAQRESALAKLRQSQTSLGGFPWFPGGPPSPYMTLYLLNGFSKALEFGVDVPREMVQPAWNYMHRHYLDDIVKEMMNHDNGWEFVTFINYVLSNYPDAKWYEGTFTPAERKTMLDFSFKHWKDHSPYLKGYLALTLKRMGRPKDAMLVWESVMDSAKTAEDQGTFWAPEDRAWLWYNDTIETHAFAIRTDMELIPADPKLDGMVLWLFLNKKMNHWKSTRATAEVIYSLAHYLKTSGQLGIREDATVTIGNQKTAFVFEPDQYTGKKNQIVIPGEKIDSKTTSTVTVEKTSKGHLFASATWHFSTEQLPEEERGDYLRLTRTYFKRVNTGKEFTLQPLKEGAALAPGDEVEVHLSLTSKHPMEYVHLRDPRGAGFEPVSNLSKHKWDLGLVWYEEIRDSGTNFFFEHIPQGEFTFKYRIRAATAGTFKVAPAIVQPMYAPEFAAYSSGATINIKNAIDSKE
jgi:alpha-2-macroglobulin